MKVRVQCYSPFKADERPVRFQLNQSVYFVEELLDQWYGPADRYFKVRADDGNLYILRHDTSVPGGEWSLESFRRARHSTSSEGGVEHAAVGSGAITSGISTPSG